MLKSNPKWGARDRAFIAETTYDIVRNFRLLAELLGYRPKTEADFYKIFAIWRIIRNEGLPEWEEFKGLDPMEIRKKKRKLFEDRRTRESIPNWLDTIGEAELGPLWEPTLAALNEQARLVVRTNTLRVERGNLQKILAKEEIESRPLGDDGLLIEKRTNLFRTEAFKEGFFEIMDFSSQQVAPFLGVEPGMRVVDACAGGGGKTLHLAALMGNKGRILALDTEAWKLEELRKRARRALSSIIETREIDTTKVIKRLYGTADRLLLDVPCSGLGVLRRNPDAKWKLNLDFIDRVRATQQELLQHYSPIVKPGGRMVYATCSILPSENENQVQKFLQSRAGAQFSLIKERRILPQEAGFDGFYMALLERKADENAPKSEVVKKQVTEVKPKPIKAEKAENHAGFPLKIVKREVEIEKIDQKPIETPAEIPVEKPKRKAKSATIPAVEANEPSPEILPEKPKRKSKKAIAVEPETEPVEPEILAEKVTAKKPRKPKSDS